MIFEKFIDKYWRGINLAVLGLTVITYKINLANNIEPVNIPKVNVYGLLNPSHHPFRNVSISGVKNYLDYESSPIVTETINEHGEFKERNTFLKEEMVYWQETTNYLFDGDRTVSQFTTVKIASELEGIVIFSGAKLGRDEILTKSGEIYSLNRFKK